MLSSQRESAKVNTVSTWPINVPSLISLKYTSYKPLPWFLLPHFAFKHVCFMSTKECASCRNDYYEPAAYQWPKRAWRLQTESLTFWTNNLQMKKPLAALSVKAGKQNHHQVLQQKDLNWNLLPKLLEELKGQMETTGVGNSRKPLPALDQRDKGKNAGSGTSEETLSLLVKVFVALLCPSLCKPMD